MRETVSKEEIEKMLLTPHDVALSNETHLRVGDLVEVLSQQEILETLDENGELEQLPFMPEMLKFCGQRLRVDKVAFKACDTVTGSGMLRMHRTVHLTDARCDGLAHGGCQAACLLYWKEAWLRKVSETRNLSKKSDLSYDESTAVCTIETLSAATRKDNGTHEEPLYSCQATELLRAAPERIPSWSVEQYIEDVRSGNAGVQKVLLCLLIGVFNEVQDVMRRSFPRYLAIRGGRRFPFIDGKLRKTPEANLGLRPGELVRIKPKKEIVRTLDVNNRNRGLSFDPEMTRFCGHEARVERRVEQIIDERSGRMTHLRNSCIILEDVVCPGAYHRCCPRSTFPYWREIWLERVIQAEEDHKRSVMAVGLRQLPRQARSVLRRR